MMPNGRNIGSYNIHLFGAAESLLPEWRYFQVQKTDSVVSKLSGPFARELAVGANTRSIQGQRLPVGIRGYVWHALAQVLITPLAASILVRIQRNVAM